MNNVIFNVTVDLDSSFDLGADFPDFLITETSHELKLTINDSGAALDISGITSSAVHIKEDDSTATATVLDASGTFETDGTDGKINFVIPSDLIPASLALLPQSSLLPKILYSVRLEDANSKIQVRKLISIKDIDGI